MPPISTTLKTQIKPQDPTGAFLWVLTKKFPYLSEEEWKVHIYSRRVLLNDKPADCDSLVNVGDSLSYSIKDHDEGDFPTDIPVIWEDSNFLLVNKPAGLPVHRSGRIFWHTLTNLLRQDRDSDEISPLHRLDRETSGLVLMIKNSKMRKQLKFALERVLHEKFYLAWVWGDWNHSHGSEIYHINQSLGTRPDSPIRIQMHCSDPVERRKTDKLASSDIQPLWSGELKISGADRAVSLLKVQLHSGRKHQIRAHLANEGHPIVGDKIYSQGGKYYLKQCQNEELDENEWRELGAKTQLLHAFELTIGIPPTNEEGKITKARFADLKVFKKHSQCWSDDFQKLMSQINLECIQ